MNVAPYKQTQLIIITWRKNALARHIVYGTVVEMLAILPRGMVSAKSQIKGHFIKQIFNII